MSVPGRAGVPELGQGGLGATTRVVAFGLEPRARRVVLLGQRARRLLGPLEFASQASLHAGARRPFLLQLAAERFNLVRQALTERVFAGCGGRGRLRLGQFLTRQLPARLPVRRATRPSPSVRSRGCLARSPSSASALARYRSRSLCSAQSASRALRSSPSSCVEALFRVVRSFSTCSLSCRSSSVTAATEAACVSCRCRASSMPRTRLSRSSRRANQLGALACVLGNGLAQFFSHGVECAFECVARGSLVRAGLAAFASSSRRRAASVSRSVADAIGFLQPLLEPAALDVPRRLLLRPRRFEFVVVLLEALNRCLEGEQLFRVRTVDRPRRPLSPLRARLATTPRPPRASRSRTTPRMSKRRARRRCVRPVNSIDAVSPFVTRRMKSVSGCLVLRRAEVAEVLADDVARLGRPRTVRAPRRSSPAPRRRPR